ncbi:methyl-accepting chemotaxis protein [Telmatospirillum sp.]|uniref:methyl-accepting chemotaxis protein n=1 Tax=Telmatospirillum sp. TaxID=2079197 RepID=UPI00284100A1|nr:methyl-accepting chemotaxis protein [Telmatospirillum sp.]MDR3436176.1 methyl-accepting chemotaxis protein [Telmatospirillum sp.]
MTYLFVVQTEKDITFAAKELQGCAYFAALHVELHGLIGLAQGGVSPADLAKVQAKVLDIDAAKAATMDAVNSARSAAEAVRAALALPKGSPAAAYDAAIDAVLVHIGRVEDGSNLTLDPDLDSYYTQDLVTVKLPSVMIAANRVLTAALPLAGTAKPTPEIVAAFLTHKSEFATALAGLDGDIASGERGNPDGSMKPAIDGPHANLMAGAAAFSKALDAILSQGDGSPSIDAIRRAQAAFLSSADALSVAATGELDRLLTARIDSLQTKMAWSLALVGLVLLATIAFSWWIARSINGPVGHLVEVMERMAAGDLSSAVPDWGRGDELGDLARSAGETRRQLHALAMEVRAHADQVLQATKKITTAVEAEAAVSSEMSSSVAEITATMEEFSTSSSQIAEHAQSVADIANLTWENAKGGVEAMELLTARMTDIQDDNKVSLDEIIDLGSKSKEISQVMKIINVIADQTKLIAFNAALEASGAGEAGKRFGVVAAEIRRLADSVTDSTGQIEAKIELIQDAIQRLVITSEKGANNIASGMVAASGTATQMNKLVDAAQHTANAAQQISLSTQQQKTASAQVVVALREIVAASSHTAQSIAHISESGQTMIALTDELAGRIGQFRLEAPTGA